MEHILVPCVPYTQASSHLKQGCRVESWAGCPMRRGSPEPHGPSVLEPGWHQHVQPCSQGGQNKAPQTGWLRTIERYSFAVLEARSRATLPLKAPGENPYSPLPAGAAACGPRHCFNPALVVTWPSSPLCLSVSVCPLLFL